MTLNQSEINFGLKLGLQLIYHLTEANKTATRPMKGYKYVCYYYLLFLCLTRITIIQYM